MITIQYNFTAFIRFQINAVHVEVQIKPFPQFILQCKLNIQIYYNRRS